MGNIDLDIETELRNVCLSGLEVKPSPKHPKADELLEYSNTHLKNLGLTAIQDLSDFNFYTFPLLKNFEMASFFVVNNHVGFILDDFLDKHPEEYKKWMEYFHLQKCPGIGILELYFQYVVQTGKEVIGEKALEHLLKLNSDWMTKCPELENCWEGKKALRDEDFLELRSIDSGAQWQFYYVQLDSGLEILPNGLIEDKNWIKFHKEAAKHLVIINELFSLRKEIRDGKMRGNYVYIKMKNNNLTAQEAVDLIVAEAKQSEKDVINLGKSLSSLTDDNNNTGYLKGYVAQVTAMLYGNMYWSTFCKRYNSGL